MYELRRTSVNTQIMSNTQHLTSEELTERFGLPSKRTLDNWAYRGIGPAYLRIGRHRRYRLEDVEAYEAAQRRGGDAA